MHLSVVIPAYNEEKRLPKTIEKINEYLSKQNYDYEIIVVNDGSKDKTVEVSSNLKSQIPNLKFIDNKENHGKGFVVRQGIMASQGEYRLFTDADNSTSIDHIEKMWPLFEQGYEIVIGTRDSRDVKEAKQAVPQPMWKRLLGDIGNLVIQLLLVPGIWDTQCGFKCFTAKTVEEIFPHLKINRWAFDVEILALARKMGYKIGIVPIYWINDPESKVKIKDYIRTFKEILIIKWWLMTGKYKLKLKTQNQKH